MPLRMDIPTRAGNIRCHLWRNGVDEVGPVGRANSGHVIPAGASGERRVGAESSHIPTRRERIVADCSDATLADAGAPPATKAIRTPRRAANPSE